MGFGSKIHELFFGKKDVEELPDNEPELETSFVVQSNDGQEHRYRMKDEEEPEYKDTTKGRRYEADIRDYNINAIHVSGNYYDRENIDSILTLDRKSNDYRRITDICPSQGLAFSINACSQSDIEMKSIFFFEIASAAVTPWYTITYTAGRPLLYQYKDEHHVGGNKSIGEEITFCPSYDMKGQHNLMLYTGVEEPKRDYELVEVPIIFGNNDSQFKGTIIQNLKLASCQNEALQIDQMARKYSVEGDIEPGAFEEFALELYRKYGDSLGLIQMANGIMIIRGTDKDENTIYTTLKEKDLSMGLREIKEKSKFNKTDSEGTEPVQEGEIEAR